jgi:hypothetical protein
MQLAVSAPAREVTLGERKFTCTRLSAARAPIRSLQA